MIKLLVVDQHPVIRKGLELVFNSSLDLKVVGSIGDGEAIFDFIKNDDVDIILTEIDLPKLNGITALRRLKKDYPEIKVIMFSGHPEEIYAVSSIKAGAVGYINKTCDLITLKEAIVKVSKGGIYLSNALAQSLAFGSKSNRNDTHYKKLSTREVEVLQLLSSGRRNKEIARELDINEKTVSTYRSRLMRKLNVTNLVDLINQASQLEL